LLVDPPFVDRLGGSIFSMKIEMIQEAYKALSLPRMRLALVVCCLQPINAGIGQVAADSTPYEKSYIIYYREGTDKLLDKSVRRREMSKICGSPSLLSLRCFRSDFIVCRFQMAAPNPKITALETEASSSLCWCLPNFPYPGN